MSPSHTVSLHSESRATSNDEGVLVRLVFAWARQRPNKLRIGTAPLRPFRLKGIRTSPAGTRWNFWARNNFILDDFPDGEIKVGKALRRELAPFKANARLVEDKKPKGAPLQGRERMLSHFEKVLDNINSLRKYHIGMSTSSTRWSDSNPYARKNHAPSVF